VGFWNAGKGSSSLWWNHGIPAKYEAYLNAALATGLPLALVAAQWRSVVESIRDEAKEHLPSDDYREISYEDFVSEPLSMMESLWIWLDLPKSDRAIKEVSNFKIETKMDEKWRSDFLTEDQLIIQYWLNLPI
jgi:hypothetical protein